MRYVIKTNKGYLYSGTTFFEYTADIFKAKNFQTKTNATKWANNILDNSKYYGNGIEFAKVYGITINEIEL